MTKFSASLFVWTGGALFVASLALTAWAYGLWWGDSQPWNGWTPVLLDAGIFLVFATHHSVFARARVKAAVGTIVANHLLRSVYVWIASILLIAVCLSWRRIGGDLYDARSSWLVIAHSVVQLSGVWLIARSVGAIDALELAGIRHRRSPAATDTLQVHGPYRLVRHPLYLGWLLIVFGPPHMTGDRLTFAVITTLYLALAIPWEERSLQDTFGEQYVNYKRDVRWRMVPYLY